MNGRSRRRQHELHGQSPLKATRGEGKSRGVSFSPCRNRPPLRDSRRGSFRETGDFDGNLGWDRTDEGYICGRAMSTIAFARLSLSP